MKNRQRSRVASILLAAGMLTGLLTGCSGVKPTNPNDGRIVNDLTAEEMQQDLDQMTEALEKNHKNLYFSISKEEFDAQVSELSARIPQLTPEQFCFEAMRISALVGDSHTGAIYPTARKKNLSLLPFEARRFEDGWHITAIDSKYSGYLGWKIEGIGGFDSEEVRQRLAPYVAHDNDVWLDASVTNILNSADFLTAAGIISDNTKAVIKASDGSGDAEFELASVKLERLNSDAFARCDFIAPSTAKEGEYYRYSDEDGILFIQYNQCSDDPRKSVKKFTEEVSGQLSGKTAVVVDLRYNSGGNSSLLDNMVTLLSGFDGKKFVLVGEETFSSAILNAYSLKNEADAVIVGTPSGGSANHYGELGSVVLRNSGMLVCYSTKYFENLPGEGIHPIMPDVEVTHTFEDYVSGIDPEMEQVRAMLD